MQPTPTPRFADARQLAVLSVASLARLLVDRDPVLARAIDLIFVVEGDCPISHNVARIENGFSLQALFRWDCSPSR
jgi:hypothetical protein